jgi:spermidine/putrescine transport system ATP-binding protein
MTTVDVELVNVIKEFPARRGEAPVRAVDNVSLQIMKGEFFALLGPSGCGKTTTLRMIAGFEDTSAGQILLRGKPVQDVPPFHRPVNTVFQEYALFPHMTALQNVMFGLEMENVPRKEAAERAMKALELVKLPQAANRKPAALSGGQQQRVALARALVKNPTVLLLDEPLGALDLKLRKEMQYELKQMQETLGITFIFVTHDQEEAMTMADRIAVMNFGEVLQVGTPEEIYEAPHTRFVAEFIGETNFITGVLKSKRGSSIGIVELSDGSEVGAIMDDPNRAIGENVTIVIRPEKVHLFPAEGSVKTTQGVEISSEEMLRTSQDLPNIVILNGRIKRSFYIGTDMRHIVSVGETDIEIIVRSQNYGQRFDQHFEQGEAIYIYWVDENARILRD